MSKAGYCTIIRLGNEYLEGLGWNRGFLFGKGLLFILKAFSFGRLNNFVCYCAIYALSKSSSHMHALTPMGCCMTGLNLKERACRWESLPTGSAVTWGDFWPCLYPDFSVLNACLFSKG